MTILPQEWQQHSELGTVIMWWMFAPMILPPADTLAPTNPVVALMLGNPNLGARDISRTGAGLMGRGQFQGGVPALRQKQNPQNVFCKI